MVVAGVGFMRVQKQFFPISERPELFFQMRMPEGTAIGATLATAKKGEALLADDPDIATYSTYVGQGSPRFWLGLNPQLPNEAFAEIVIVTKDVFARERVKRKLEAAVADGALSEARVRVDRFNFGPPVGFPVQFRVMGLDAKEVRDIAYRVRDVMRADNGIRDPHLDWNERMPSVRLVLDQDRARAMGLTPQDVATSLQMLVSGLTVTTVRDGVEKVDVVARAAKGERADLGHLGDLTIMTRTGASVPVAQVATVVYEHEDAILWRRSRDTTITVRADVVDGVQPPDVTTRIWPRLADIRDHLPAGYRIEMGGAIEESTKANGALVAVFPVMILAMLAIVMIQLQNFMQLALVMISAPLGVIGASLGLNIAGAPFGFVALLGLIALAGMDMRNSIILVDQVRQDLERGATYREAIIEIDRAARPSGRADRARRHPRDDPAVALGLLGPDGHRHHGRPVRGDLPDAALPSGALCAMVPQESEGGGGPGRIAKGRQAPRRPDGDGGRMSAAMETIKGREGASERDPETRRRIVETAERLYREIGFQKTTVADIARELRMSPANVYRYFASKAEINGAVARHLLGEVVAAITAIVEGPGGAGDRLRKVINTNQALNAERFIGRAQAA